MGDAELHERDVIADMWLVLCLVQDNNNNKYKYYRGEYIFVLSLRPV